MFGIVKQGIGNATIQGDVLLYDDANYVFPWVVSGTATAKTVTADATYMYQQKKSMLAKNNDSPPVDEETVIATRQFCYKLSKKVRLDLFALIVDTAGCNFLDFQIKIQTGTQIITAGVRLDIHNERAWYYKAGGTWERLDAVNVGVQKEKWFSISIEVDPQLTEYSLIEVGGMDIMEDGIECQGVGSLDGVNSEIIITGEQNGEVTALSYAVQCMLISRS